MYFNAAQFMAFANQDGMQRMRQEIRFYNNGTVQQRQYWDPYGWNNSISPDAITEEEATQYLNAKLDAIANRDLHSVAGHNTAKWHRPWDIVPEVRDWQAPAGDFGVGVEVEMGFVSLEAARQVAQHVRDWEYITLDYEGGTYPIELTFPPTEYSNFENSRAVEYLDYLKENEALVVKHGERQFIGTHINVSPGGGVGIPTGRCHDVEIILECMFRSARGTALELAIKYFGRTPYGFAYGQGCTGNDYRWVEFKLFNSQLESSRLLQYADIAVALVKLMMDEATPITNESVHIALEEGYQLRANVSEEAAIPQLAIAA